MEACGGGLVCVCVRERDTERDRDRQTEVSGCIGGGNGEWVGRRTDLFA